MKLGAAAFGGQTFAVYRQCFAVAATIALVFGILKPKPNPNLKSNANLSILEYVGMHF